jgi:glutathione S-transferase
MAEPSSVRFVDLETARASRGLRLAVITSVPSLWSDAARGMAAAKELDCLAVEFDPRDESIPRWTGCPNAPVALYADQLPRTGWAEILSLLERLGGKISLVPSDPAERADLFGLSHEVCGETGLGWIRRLLILHSSFASGGTEGFPLPIARFLARRYGYSPEWVQPARRRFVDILGLLDRQLARAGGAYFFGSRLSALDFYWAAALGALLPLPDSVRPIAPLLRPALERLDDELANAISPALREHRDRIAPRWLALPGPVTA